MSESVLIALIGSLLGMIELLTATILGWIAFELRHMRKALEGKVDREDCKIDMCSHASEIRNLWSETRKNAEAIARMGGCAHKR